MFEWMITSSALILVIIIVRRIFMGRISLRLQYGLWLLVLIRLLCPVMITGSSFSVLNLFYLSQDSDGSTSWRNLPEEGTVSADGNMYQAAGNTEGLETGLFQNGAGDHLQYSPKKSAAAGEADAGGVRADSAFRKNRILWVIWIAGAVTAGIGILVVNICFSVRLHRVRAKWEAEGKREINERPPVYLVKKLQTPCLFGLLRPAIYLPQALCEGKEQAENAVSETKQESLGDAVRMDQLHFILIHERNHYRHGDHIWAFLRNICLILHWYNPFVWAAVILSRRDSELACDESTVHELGEAYRMQYGKALIDMTAEKGFAGDFLCCATSLASGKKGMKERITLLAKKPRMLAVSVCMLLFIVIAAAGCSFTGKRKQEAAGEEYIEEHEDTAGTDAENMTEDSDEPKPDAENRTEDSDEPKPDTENRTEDSDVPEYERKYDMIESTTIDNDFFTMTVPEDFVNEVGYEVDLKYDNQGGAQLADVTFFINSMTSFRDTAQAESESGTGEMTDRSGGDLGGVIWRGMLEYESQGILEELMLYTASTDFRQLDKAYLALYSLGPEGAPVDLNTSETGAYCYWHPSDVQWNPEIEGEEEIYLHYKNELEEALSSFRAKSYPYEIEDSRQYEVLMDFLKAEEALSWFSGYNEAEVVYGEDRMFWPYDGGPYYLPVSQYGISTMSELKAYLRQYFPEETAETLPEKTVEGYVKFIERDGVLYTARGLEGIYHFLYGRKAFEVVFSENGKEADLRICIEMTSGAGERITTDAVYHLEYGENNIWKVTGDFRLPIEAAFDRMPEVKVMRDSPESEFYYSIIKL